MAKDYVFFPIMCFNNIVGNVKILRKWRLILLETLNYNYFTFDIRSLQFFKSFYSVLKFKCSIGK